MSFSIQRHLRSFRAPVRSPRSSMRRASALSAAVLLAMGCGKDTRAEDAAHDGDDARLLQLVLPAWSASTGEAPPPRFIKRRQLGTDGAPPASDPARGARQATRTVEREAPAEVAGSEFGVTLEDGSDYDIAFPEGAALLPEVARMVQEPGVNPAASSELDSEASPAREKGFSGNVDNRMRWAGETGFPKSSIGAWVYGAGGRDSFCTGTLIGSRHVLTAAHCLYDKTGSLWDSWFVPSKEAAAERYGRQRRTLVYRNNEWMNMGCYATTTINNACGARDYAVALLETAPAGAGAMGWKSFNSIGSLSGIRVNAAGYAFGSEHAPAGATADWLYRDNDCSFDPANHFFEAGYGRVYHGCDTSLGQSGGPLWSVSLPGFENSHRVVGIISAEGCKGASCNGRYFNFPNSATLITVAVSELLSQAKAMNP